LSKALFSGNEAVARGLFETGVSVVSSYPGTPSTEITESAAGYAEMYSEWAPNEKVAVEVALGASIGGARAFAGMKHVGLNVAADPLFTASYTGVNAGLVIAVADDQGLHSSQNEQDSRHWARSAKLPMLEPADSAECLAFTKFAYELSEEYDTPVLLRLSTRVSHSRSLVTAGERADIPLKPYEKNPRKYVMMPAMAKERHEFVEARTLRLAELAERTPLNTTEENVNAKIGVITAGIAYQYAKEALGNNASYLKLGMIAPLPEKVIRDFAARFRRVVVIEELDGVIETHCKALGIPVIGKELFGYTGEYSAGLIKEKLLGEKPVTREYPEQTPPRPPVLCPGCPHRGVFYVLNKLKLTVMGDIGCYTLGALAPLSALDVCVCMGASVSSLHGINTARGADFAKSAIAVLGDSTFIHSGITGIIDIAYNKGVSTVMVLDNSITGMTGHQQNPTTGLTIKGDPTSSVNLELLARACGFNRVRVIDPFDLSGAESVLKEELQVREPSFIIARRPCALLKTVKSNPPVFCDENACTGCKMCMKAGCPAISMKKTAGKSKAQIDKTLCTGCGVCEKICRFKALMAIDS
jgi:indolepyruvate ferredoxin oxidoreductase alpha subunit